jgi:hypothetical protein
MGLFEDHVPDVADAPENELTELIGRLFERMRAYLHLDDTGHVYVALADAVSAELDGPPLWVLLVGAPSGGKTEAIEVVRGRGADLDELTVPGLLRWQPVKNGPPRAAGALPRIGERGLLTIGDFSTVLARDGMGGGARDQLFADLRRVYDGSLSRDVAPPASRAATADPGQLHWHGRVTILAACTPVIDRYAAHADALGPRWLYYRLPTASREDEKRRQRKVRAEAAKLEEHRASARELAGLILQAAARRVPTIALSDQAADALDDYAYMACLGRAAVPRHGYGRREIDGPAVVESTPRITGQLLMLARCLLALGLDEAEALALCRRCALDSMPEVRYRILAQLGPGEVVTGREMARLIGVHPNVALRALEDLEAIGLVEAERHHGEDDDGSPADGGIRKPVMWSLAPANLVLVEAIVQETSVHEMDYTHTPSPPNRPPEPDTDDNMGSSGEGVSPFRVQGDEPPPPGDADMPPLAEDLA